MAVHFLLSRLPAVLIESYRTGRTQSMKPSFLSGLSSKARLTSFFNHTADCGEIILDLE